MQRAGEWWIAEKKCKIKRVGALRGSSEKSAKKGWDIKGQLEGGLHKNMRN